jgi:hypothetical protein
MEICQSNFPRLFLTTYLLQIPHSFPSIDIFAQLLQDLISRSCSRYDATSIELFLLSFNRWCTDCCSWTKVSDGSIPGLVGKCSTPMTHMSLSIRGLRPSRCDASCGIVPDELPRDQYCNVETYGRALSRFSSAFSWSGMSTIQSITESDIVTLCSLATRLVCLVDVMYVHDSLL